MKFTIAESNQNGGEVTYNDIACVITSEARESKTGKVGWTFSHKTIVHINNTPVHVQVAGTVYALRSERWKRDICEHANDVDEQSD